MKANADKLNMAHAGVGSVVIHDLPAAQFDPRREADAWCRSTAPAPAMNALVGGQVDYMCDQIVNVVPQVTGGTIKAYAIGTARAQSGAAERADHQGGRPAGVRRRRPGTRCSRPRARRKPILDKLTDALDKALDDQNTRKRLLELGSDIPDKAQRGQAALAALVKSEIARWTPIIKAAGQI